VSWKIIWSEFAIHELDKIFLYYAEKANVRVAKKILTGIVTAPNRLVNNQSIGQIEPALKALPNQYRYLIHKRHKIIYSLNTQEKHIKIVDVFDTRQNPIKINRKK
jgi:plasmid stabilization system protein ParE